MTHHRTHDRRHLVLWWAVAAFVLVLFAHTPAARAQSTECEAVDQYDMPRECTFLEEHGMCLVNALDSYDVCVENTDSAWDRMVCELGVQVDLFACNVLIPWQMMKMILH